MRRGFSRTVAVFFAAALLAFSARAQDEAGGTLPPDTERAPKTEPAAIADENQWKSPVGNVAVVLPSDQTPGKGDLQFLVMHRAHSSIRGSNSNSLYSFSSQTVSLGFSYAPIRNSEVSLFWSENYADYELAVKYSFLPAGKPSLFGAALRVGGNDRRNPFVVLDQGGLERDVQARVSFHVQGILSVHLFSNRLEIAAIPSYASRTTTELRVFNVPVYAALALSRSVNLQVEYVPPRRALRGSVAQWRVGFEKVIAGGRHRFTAVFTNSTATRTDQYLSSDFIASVKRLQERYPFISIRNNDLYIGFNLIRNFHVGP